MYIYTISTATDHFSLAFDSDCICILEVSLFLHEILPILRCYCLRQLFVLVDEILIRLCIFFAPVDRFSKNYVKKSKIYLATHAIRFPSVVCIRFIRLSMPCLYILFKVQSRLKIIAGESFMLYSVGKPIILSRAK